MTEPVSDVLPEVRVSLTRVCLRKGEVAIPFRARSAFEEVRTFRAYDVEEDEEHELEVQSNGRLAGLKPFMEQRGLAVNDVVVVRPQRDGSFVLTAAARPRSSRRDARAVRRAVASLLEGGPPRSLEELREDFALADDAPLRAALEREPTLQRRAGRWGLADPPGHAEGGARRERVTATSRPGPDPRRASLNSVRDGEVSSPEVLARAREAFDALGYEVSAAGEGTLALGAPMGRSRQLALVRVLREGERPDWGDLIRAGRERGADALAVLGDVRDLHPLERPARGAQATLWSWEGLERAYALSQTVPIGPVDLAPSFEEDGLHGQGLERFEARIEDRVRARGLFSSVVARLAELRAPTSFTLGDLEDAPSASRDELLAVVDRLTAPPFQWVERVGPGEFALRQSVTDGLAHLSRYAASLARDLPDATRPRVRGLDATQDDAEAVDLLGRDDLVAAGAADDERPDEHG
ncbi:MAG: hypothetical protein U5K81_04735 [Trueperaceae bacterium]|nr:hypothetical protein [Trueperaceae bacterium]